MPNRRIRWRAAGGWISLGAATIATVALAGWGLDEHPFWDDEANTAIFARNLLRFGRPTAWDGTNLVGYAYGGSLGPDLGRELRVPSLPAYVAAAGMAVLGDSTAAARWPFVLCGAAAVGTLGVWLRRYLGARGAWWLAPWLLALSPAYLLYIRNCRYYALGVLGTLALLAFWAPSTGRRHWRLRAIGATVAALVLLGSHYLNALAALVALPAFFLHPRYRRREQVWLLGVVYLVAGVFGLWTLWSSNPWGAEYFAKDWLLGELRQPAGFLERFATHLGWLLRDLGSHEFFAWLLLPILLFPWLVEWDEDRPSPGRGATGDPRRPGEPAAEPRDGRGGAARAGRAPPARNNPASDAVRDRTIRLVRSKPLAVRAAMLVALVLGNVVLAAMLTPPDMAKGPLAEMRYVVPLCALGAAVSGVAVAILARASRLFAVLGMVALLGSNVLHLGFVTPRADETSPWWPPTLYRYGWEQWHGCTTSHRAMIDLLAGLPDGTTVRTWPTYMVYPPMFYLPRLHYCDQLTERKAVSPELLAALPDYLFTERAKPEVVLVPAPLAAQAIDALGRRFGEGSYELRRALAAPWYYTSKPEIPNHFFFGPPGAWRYQPGMVVLVRTDAPAASLAVLRREGCDAEEHFRLGMMLARLDRLDEATDEYATALRRQPTLVLQCIRLGRHLAQQGFEEQATAHFLAVLRALPDRAEDFHDEAERLCPTTPWLALPYYRALVAHDPLSAEARFGLGVALAEDGQRAEAIGELSEALRLARDDRVLLEEIRKLLARLRSGP